MNDRLAIGGNAPPVFETFGMALDDLYAEAGNFLDGAAIENQGQADAVGVIISTAKKLRKDADAARAEEKRPHDEAAKAVQAKWKPLLDRCDTIERAAKSPLSDWLNKLAEEQQRQEAEAREAAENAAREAAEAHKAAQGSLEATEQAKALEQAAKDAGKQAKSAAKAKAHVAGVDRAIGLRTYWTATVTDPRELLNWLLKNEPETVKGWLADYAKSRVANGARWLPGVDIQEERRVA